MPDATPGDPGLEVRYVAYTRGPRRGLTAWTLVLTPGSSIQVGYWLRYAGRVRPEDALAHHLSECAEG